MSKKVVAALLVLPALALGGCWESGDVVMHEPGQYKGRPDPLARQAAAERAPSLQKRFELVQKDR